MRQAAQQPIYTEEDYNNLPEDIRAELINGAIYYQAAPSRIHQETLSFLHVEISNYIRSKKGPCKVYPAPFAVKLQKDRETIVEPDISVICDPNKLTDRGCTGAPDWIIEIVSPSNSSHDYIRKLHLYASAGVREYWIVNPMQGSIAWGKPQSPSTQAIRMPSTPWFLSPFIIDSQNFALSFSPTYMPSTSFLPFMSMPRAM